MILILVEGLKCLKEVLSITYIFTILILNILLLSEIYHLLEMEYGKKLIKGTEISITNVAPSSPIAILVSAKEHAISTNVKSCNGITEIEETCQT